MARMIATALLVLLFSIGSAVAQSSCAADGDGAFRLLML